MREIKFRAWDLDGNKMFYPSARVGYFTFNGVVHEIIDQPVPNGTYVSVLGRLFNGITLEYTGLKDKNGKEIYEGDIVKINNLKETWKRGEPDFDWRIFAIEYNQYTWAFNNSVLYMPMSTYHDGRNGFYDYEIEVIGNIYENPKLLNK